MHTRRTIKFPFLPLCVVSVFLYLSFFFLSSICLFSILKGEICCEIKNNNNKKARHDKNRYMKLIVYIIHLLCCVYLILV
jgi:hypothetical protein